MTTPTLGRLITAMITPFAPDGSVNLDEARRLAAYLVDTQKMDALVINGTTGEAPTTYHGEKSALLKAVVAEVGDRAKVIAGVGTNDTNHTIGLAKEAEDAGADGLLVVTPYYSRPPQDAIAAHFTAVADATSTPIIIYDIPHRAGTEVAESTLISLTAHPRIIGVKDAKGNVASSARVMAATGLDYYAGDDAMLLPLMAVGAVGVVGTSTHFSGAGTRVVIDRWLAGDHDEALRVYRELLPVYTGVFATQGVMLVKAGLAARGFAPGGVRLPLLPASAEQAQTFVAVLDAAGL
ncbi:MAG: 4-hydroxy-tetrahydrodipicolinate synthase [Propionibacteriaceae bacterium]|nr:4-hydroxy-tetrahydrodipicolinate synthase [Propionibacteriaceae bacterium]